MLGYRGTALGTLLLGIGLTACGGGGSDNEAPTAGNVSLSLSEDTPAQGSFSGSDPDGDALFATIVTGPAKGDVTISGMTFTYTPRPNENGTDSFSYHLSDGRVFSNEANVTLTIVAVNDAPTALADSVHTIQGKSVRFEPLANDSDDDGPGLSVRILSAPTVGTATVDADGSIEYTPPATFLGSTSLEYEVRDAGGLTAHATVSIGVGTTFGVLYRADLELYFADGARTFKVNAPLAAGDYVVGMKAAKSAPVVYYETRSQNLYRVDLRKPGVAQHIAQVDHYLIDDTGSKVAFLVSNGINTGDYFDTTLKFVDSAAPSDVKTLATRAYEPYMNPSGSRVYYLGRANSLHDSPRAVLAVDTSGTSPPRQITALVPSTDRTETISYLSRDERRLYYSASYDNSAGKRIMGVDPEVPGSEFIIQQGPPPLPAPIEGVTQDESTYWGCVRNNGVVTCHAVQIGAPGTDVILTAGSPGTDIGQRTMLADGSSFFYASTPPNGLGKLYRVDTSNPAVATPIGGPVPTSAAGRYNFSVANDGKSLVYTYTAWNLITVLPDPHLPPEIRPVFSASILGILDLAQPDSPRELSRLAGQSGVAVRAPDDSFVAVIVGNDGFNADYDLHILNLRDPSQMLRIASMPTSPTLVPNF